MSVEEQPQPHGRFVDVDGARLYLEAWGDAHVPVLLCLHGLGGGTHFFGALGAALADRSRPDRYRTVAIDLPWSGLSPSLAVAGAPAFSFDAVADLVVSLARSEHVRGAPLCLLGHSMGTILALEAIRRAPGLAAALIVVGGLPEPLPGARARITARVDAIRQRGIAGAAGLAGMGTEVVAANFSRRSQIERPELTALFAKLFDRQDPAAYASTATALATWTARELPPLDSASARVSCLAITGEEDRYAPPDAFQAFAHTLPAATRVEIMRDCGHLPFLEQPAAFAAIVSSFLHDVGF